ncbi:MAG: type II secretion system F family protein [Actinobacteria bacterium]|nr:type II secretion system F family protein [Actinomycetota bacterium]
MPASVILGATALAASVPLLWWAVATTRQPASRVVVQNLAGGQAQLADLRRVLLEKSAGERALAPAVAALAARARRVTPAGMVDAMERRLVTGGVAHWGIERVLAAKLGLAIIGVFLTLALWGGSSTVGLLAGLLFVGVGFFGPDAILSGRVQARQQAIERELPDTLDQVTISVEAGLGFEAALARVAQTGTGPLAEELSRTLQDIQLGLPRRDALDKLVRRTQAPDLMRFVNAMRQAEGYGIPIAQVLRVQSAELRDKRRQRAEERAMKIPVKIVFPVVFCIFPTLLVTILGPAAIRLIRTWPN